MLKKCVTYHGDLVCVSSRHTLLEEFLLKYVLKILVSIHGDLIGEAQAAHIHGRTSKTGSVCCAFDLPLVPANQRLPSLSYCQRGTKDTPLDHLSWSCLDVHRTRYVASRFALQPSLAVPGDPVICPTQPGGPVVDGRNLGGPSPWP